MASQFLRRQRGLSFGGVVLGQADEPAQVGPAGRIFDQEGQMVARGQGQFAAKNGPEAMRLGGLGETNRAADVVVVGQGQGGHPQLGGAGRQVFGVSRPVEQAEVTVTMELDVVRHISGVARFADGGIVNCQL